MPLFIAFSPIFYGKGRAASYAASCATKAKIKWQIILIAYSMIYWVCSDIRGWFRWTKTALDLLLMLSILSATRLQPPAHKNYLAHTSLRLFSRHLLRHCELFLMSLRFISRLQMTLQWPKLKRHDRKIFMLYDTLYITELLYRH